MSRLKYLLLVYLSCFILTENWAYVPKFTVYAYIPWQGINTNPHTLLSNYGIRPIHIIYEANYMTDGTINYDKIKKIALKTAANSYDPVSFDMEFGNRFKPETIIPSIHAILKYFRTYNSKSLISLYATIPQNTYGQKTLTSSYEQLNNQYNSLIYWVDFISPSLYNYEKTFNSWLSTAQKTMSIAKQYPLKKPIIPYISPIVRLGPFATVKKGNLVIELTEEEMTKRLQSLYQMGASGCIIWASSQDRKQDGHFPEFNPEYGWGKAVVRFIKLHEKD